MANFSIDNKRSEYGPTQPIPYNQGLQDTYLLEFDKPNNTSNVIQIFYTNSNHRLGNGE